MNEVTKILEPVAIVHQQGAETNTVLRALANVIGSCIDRAKRSKRDYLTALKDAGEALENAFAECERSGIPWKEYCEGLQVTEQTAGNYRRLSRHWNERILPALEKDPWLPASAAYKLCEDVTRKKPDRKADTTTTEATGEEPKPAPKVEGTATVNDEFVVPPSPKAKEKEPAEQVNELRLSEELATPDKPVAKALRWIDKTYKWEGEGDDLIDLLSLFDLPPHQIYHGLLRVYEAHASEIDEQEDAKPAKPAKRRKS
jgi:hypothetical protein